MNSVTSNGAATGPDVHCAAGARDPRPWELAAVEFGRWQQGDALAFERLVRLLTPVLWHVVRAYGLDRSTAEDAVQATWLALIRCAGSIRDPQAVARWLTTTARREAWRAAGPRHEEMVVTEVLEAATPPTPGPEAIAVADAATRSLWRQVARLPERCRRLLRVVAFEDRPDYASLSAQLDMPVGGIGPTRRRCLDKLRSLLSRDPEWSQS